MYRLAFLIFIFIFFSGCATLSPLLEEISPSYLDLMKEQRKLNEPDKVQKFQILLRDGWELFIYDEDRLVLIKHTNSGLLINDVFGVLTEDE